MPRGGLENLKAENSRLLRDEIRRGATVHRALPEIVTLNSTDICNLKCVMCPRNLAQGTFRLEDRVVEYVADELFPTALKTNLTTAGGEPLGPGFDVILERALRYGVRIDVVTNGMLLDGEIFARMLPALDHLNVSVDCSVPAVYERLRVGGSFDRLLANLEEIHAVRARERDDVLFSMSAVVMKSNLPYLPELIRFAAEHRAGGVVLQRLRHEVKPTWEEDVPSHYAPEEIEGHLARTEAAAREAGINLYQAELGRPNLFHREQRPKVPETLDGAGVCYFLSQSFSVMYTGEVYPCCKPTDYKLGDVRFESPIDIWNGEPLQKLRAAHFSRRGTLFCSGCEYAPHLPARGEPRVNEVLRRGRRAYAHVANNVVRRASERLRPKVFETAPPAHVRLDPVPPANGLPPLEARALGVRHEAGAVHPRDGSFWFVKESSLWRCADALEPPEWKLALENPGGGEAACLAALDSGAFLVSFEGSGELLRVEGDEATSALELSDARSRVRRNAVTQAPDSAIWAGEYGVFPGARCAWLYRSVDDGRTFEAVEHFPDVRHVHAVACSPSSGSLFVTTGDLPTKQRTYVRSTGARSSRLALESWAGFTAIAFSGGFVHFGTDLSDENGFCRAREGLDGRLEFRPLHGELDLQVRQIERLADGRLFALGSLDENLTELRAVRRAALFLSDDDGAAWTVAHRFAADWSDAPERFVVLPGTPTRLATEGTRRPSAIRLP